MTNREKRLRQLGICACCVNKYKCLVDKICAGFSPQTPNKHCTYRVLNKDSKERFDTQLVFGAPPEWVEQTTIELKIKEDIFELTGEMRTLNPHPLKPVIDIFMVCFNDKKKLINGKYFALKGKGKTEGE